MLILWAKNESLHHMQKDTYAVKKYINTIHFDHFDTNEHI